MKKPLENFDMEIAYKNNKETFEQLKVLFKQDTLLAQLDIKISEYLSTSPFQTGVLEIYGTTDEITQVILETSSGEVNAIDLFEHNELWKLITDRTRCTACEVNND